MSGGSKSTTQTTNAEPWEKAQPALELGLGDAQNLYKSGQGFQPYTGSTVVPFADQTSAGMGDIQNRSLSAMSGPNPFDSGFNFFGGMFDTQGLSADQRGIGDQWRTTASGSELNNTSPQFENLVGKVLGDARTGIDLSMSGAGRYGSPGAHTSVLARELGDLSDRMRTSEYARQLGRMDSARTNLANLGQQGITNQFGAASQLPSAWDARNMPASDLMRVGSMYEDLAGRTMSDNMRIFQETQQAPLRAVEWLNAIGSGAGSLGGTSASKSTQPGSNPFTQILGGGLGLASLLSGGLF